MPYGLLVPAPGGPSGPWPTLGPNTARERTDADGSAPPLGVGALWDPPWAAWCVALCEEWQVSTAGARSVDVLDVVGPLPASGVAWALSLPDGATVLAAAAQARGPAGPAALAFGLPAALAGHPLDPDGLAAASRVISLHRARLQIWLDADDGALRNLLPSPLLDAWLADPTVGPALRLSLAGRRQAITRRHELLTLLAAPPARAVEARAWRDALSALDGADLPAPLGGWVSQWHRAGAWVDSAATFRGLATAIAPRTTPPDAAALDRAERAAAAFILREGGLASTWERQHWGVGEHDGPLVSRWFPEGLVLQALHEAGMDQGARISSLLAELPVELRWYAPEDAAPGQVWRGIPPDADSLGLMLQLASACPGLPPDRAPGWWAWLQASLPRDRRIPTWFYTAPGGGSSIEGPAWQFASNDCTTARLTCMTGLLVSDLPGALDLVRDNLPFVMPCFQRPGQTGDFFYSEVTCELAWLRFARRWCDRLPDDPLTGRITDLCRTMADRHTLAQRLDGGWGSPLDSAQRLEGLALWGGAALALRRGLRFLDEHQRPDGAWPPEPYYLMPGKSLHHVEHHASYEVSAALCLRALCAARRALRAARGT